MKLFSTLVNYIYLLAQIFFISYRAFSNLYFYLGDSEESKLLIERSNYYWTMPKGSTTPTIVQKLRDKYDNGDGYFNYRGYVGNKYLIDYANYDTEELELWVTDGTESGTIQLAIFNTPPAS